MTHILEILLVITYLTPLLVCNVVALSSYFSKKCSNAFGIVTIRQTIGLILGAHIPLLNMCLAVDAVEEYCNNVPAKRIHK